jgi:hypothetical protein
MAREDTRPLDHAVATPHHRGMRRRGAVLLIGVAAVGGAAFVLSGWAPVPERHEDGAGLLWSSPGTTLTLTMGADRPGASWSYAIFLCAADPSRPPSLVEVRPTGMLGGDYLGAVFLEHPEQAGELLQNGRAFPPAELDPAQLRPVADQRVTPSCGPGTVPSQVLMGLRLGPDGGGGWTGEEIVYRHRGGTSTLVLHHPHVFCGDSITTADCDEWRARRETQETPSPAAS